MSRFNYFANWKSYAFAYTPSVDTVINDFTITLSYVKTTKSYYIGLPNKQYDTLYAGANRTIRGAIWSSTNIYASSSKVAESVNDVDLFNNCTNYTGYDASATYNSSKFRFDSVLLKAGVTYYIGVYDINSKADKLYNQSTIMIAVDSGSTETQQLYDCINTASKLTRSTSGGNSLMANVSFGVSSKPKLNIDFINFVDNRKSLTARFNLSSSFAISDDYDLVIGYRLQLSSAWKYVNVGKYKDIDNVKTVEMGYSLYAVKLIAVSVIDDTTLAESSIIAVNGTKPSVSVSMFSYNTGVTEHRLPLLVSFNGVAVVGDSLEYSYKFESDTSYTSLGTYAVGKTTQMTISPALDWGYIYFSVKNSIGVYSDDISQYFDCVNAKISNAHIVKDSITISSADISVATSYSPAIVVSIECGSFSSTTKSKSTIQILPITGLVDGTDYSVYVSVRNTINNSNRRTLVKLTTLNAVWKELLPLIYTGGHWINVTPYIYSEEAREFIECKPYMAISKN